MGKVGQDVAGTTLLLFKHVTTVFEQEPAGARRKLTKGEPEEKAEEAAFVVNLGLLAQQEVPFPDDMLMSYWLEPYATGETSVALEVQCAMGHKYPKLTPRGISKLAAACRAQLYIIVVFSSYFFVSLFFSFSLLLYCKFLYIVSFSSS